MREGVVRGLAIDGAAYFVSSRFVQEAVGVRDWGIGDVKGRPVFAQSTGAKQLVFQ